MLSSTSSYLQTGYPLDVPILRQHCLYNQGSKINFFVQEPAGDQQKNFGRQFVNLGRQPNLYNL